MKGFYLRATLRSSMALFKGLSNVMAAEITVSEDRADFVLTQETFPYSGGTLANLQGKPDHAVKKLEDALERTDGCILRGSVDGNGDGRDWITNGDAENNAYNLLSAAIGALAP